MNLWAKYYTPAIVARAMVNLIHVSAPKSVIDICVGSWNLLRAAHQRWDDIQLVGVDINSSPIHSLPPTGIFYNMDGRHFALKCLEKGRKFPVVMANPPFGRLNEDDEFFADLPGCSEMPKAALQRLETTMILANLSLLNEDGFLVAIVPSTLIDGEWAKCLRVFIGTNFQLHYIIGLPHNIFGRDIQTSILVIQKKVPSDQIVTSFEYAQEENETLKFKPITTIELDHIRKGEWIFPILAVTEQSGLQIIRGGISSSFLKQNGKHPVLHSTDISGLRDNKWLPTRFCEYKGNNPITKLVKKGDLILIRVGRNCGQATLLDIPYSLPASDCILIMRHSNSNKQKELLKIVNSTEYKEDIKSLRKGVSTFYLTQDSLINYFETKLNI